MKRKNRCWVLLPGLIVIWGVSNIAIANPFNKLFRQVESDPEKSYVLTENEGPWVILAVTFSGDGAEQQAKELVLEMRSRFKLPAYTHKMNLNLNQSDLGTQVTRSGRPVRMRYRREEINEIAVLVGNYPSADDPEAQKTLEKIKRIEPDCMSIEKLEKEGKKDYRALGGLRWMQQQLLSSDSEKKNRGPMRQAFITTNPLLPDEYFVPSGLEPFVIELNKDLEYSLLNCPGAVTVRVATFKGAAVVDPDKIRGVESGEYQLVSQLAEAAENAHKLTLALRAKGYEAYEFHDRVKSIVTVGSFASAGTVGPNGQLQPIPQVDAVIKAFEAPKIRSSEGNLTGYGTPKSVAGMPLDIEPAPETVPKRSLSMDYDSSRFNLK